MATKAQIIAEINTNFPDNNTGLITPALQRSTLTDLVNSYQDLNGSITTTPSGFFYAPLSIIFRLADRLFVGDATLNNGTQVGSQPDWLTTFEISTGRSGGFIQEAQFAALNGSDPQAVNTVVVGAQTQNIILPGLNAIGAINVAVNNNSTLAVSAYGLYNEAYRVSGAIGGAYGAELDTINFASSVTIDPFTQNGAETIGLQLAAGAGLSSAGQFPASAAINIRDNNSSFNQAICIGNAAISGTNGTDGNVVGAIQLATGHAIDYYYGSGNRSWRFSAGIGANGNYSVTTAGGGSFVFGMDVFGPRLNANGSGGAGYVQASNQSAAPSTPTTAIRIYADASNRLALKGTNGFNTTIDPTANTADRNYTLPNVSGPITVNGGLINFALTGVNFNSANTDTTIPIVLPPGNTRYVVALMYITGASASISTATAGLFTAAAGGGVPVVSNSAITVTSSADATNNNAMSFTPATANTQSYTVAGQPNLFFRVGTAQGSAATANVVVQIRPLP